MLLAAISEAEINFIRGGCDLGVRADGRGHDDMRAMNFENDTFPHVNSSSRVRCFNGTDVICSITVEVDQPEVTRLDEGLLTVHVDISPSSCFGFDDRDISNYAQELSDKMQSCYYSSPLFPWKSLCILKGKYVWHIKVDLLILQLDANPLDLCSLAAYIAFQKLRFPEFDLTIGKNELSSVLQDFEIVSDPSKSVFHDFSNIPIIISLYKISNKSLVMDATRIEQSCASAIVMFGIDRSFDCSSISILKHGSLSSTDLTTMLEKAVNAARGNFAQLTSFRNSTAFQSEDEDLFAETIPSRYGLLA